MDQIVIYLALVLLGACIGSFAGAMVWRLRARQLSQDKDAKQPYDRKEYNRLKKFLGVGALKDRSKCLHCDYTLKWYDLIPVVSWLALGGKCRNCRKPIGWFEILIELGLVAFFVGSYALWPGGVQTGLATAHFALWLVAGSIMAMMFAYDFKWFLLPDRLSVILAIVGVAIVGVSAAESGDVWQTILTAIGAVGVLAGLYGLLFAISKGTWVGFGDVKLGVGLGLILVDWQLAVVALFLANLIGFLIVIPLLVAKQLKRSSHIPFGPLLISGTVLALLFGWQILDFYLGFIV